MVLVFIGGIIADYCVSIYEDRLPHVQAFREFFDKYNNTIARVGRKQLLAEVVHVAALTVSNRRSSSLSNQEANLALAYSRPCRGSQGNTSNGEESQRHVSK